MMDNFKAQIYLRAMEILHEELEDTGDVLGCCDALLYSTNECMGDCAHLEELFPEFFALRPRRFYAGYWWPLTSDYLQHRIRALTVALGDH